MVGMSNDSANKLCFGRNRSSTWHQAEPHGAWRSSLRSQDEPWMLHCIQKMFSQVFQGFPHYLPTFLYNLGELSANKPQNMGCFAANVFPKIGAQNKNCNARQVFWCEKWLFRG